MLSTISLKCRPRWAEIRMLALIRELYEQGQWISTSFAPQASNGAFAVLSAHPRFPPFLTRRALEPLLRAARVCGELIAETYKAPGRHRGERWKVR